MPTSNAASLRADSVAAPEKNLSPLVWLGGLALVNLLGPFVSIPNLFAAITGTLGLTLGYLALVIAFALGVARLKMPIPRALAWLGASALVWAATQLVFEPVMQRTARELFLQHRRPTLGQQFGFTLVSTLQDLALFCGATFAGTLLARLIRHANMVGPIGAAIVLIDTWGVLFGGIVSQLMSNKATQPLAAKAVSSGPKLGAAHAAQTGFAINLPSIGVGDFLFIALLLSVLVNLSMNWRTSARLMWVLVTVVLLSMQLLPFIPALPGLVPIGVAAVLPNWGFFKFTREERFALLYAGVFVLLLTIGLYFGFTSILPHPNK